MPTCLCNREEALEILSQNLYPKTYDKLNEEYDRLKKYNKKLKQIEFYIDIMVNSLLNKKIRCIIRLIEDEFYEVDDDEEPPVEYIDDYIIICDLCKSVNITLDLLNDCYECKTWDLCDICHMEHKCCKIYNIDNNNFIKHNNNYICGTCDTKSYYNKIVLLNNINSLQINNKLLYRKIYHTLINLNYNLSEGHINVRFCKKCFEFRECTSGYHCHCNIEYKDEIYKKFNHLIYYIDNYAYEYGVFDINKIISELLEE